jgi:isoleucyl-tRNA synthetase
VIGAAYGLPTLTPVDDGGVFTSEAGGYAGRRVFEANTAIVADLKASGALLHSENLSHSYPHCWRCKNPLIFRATEQWFLRVDHNGLRERALKEIDQVNWVPGWSRDRIRNMVETRPDWCLSRQRAWGVPIPALRCAGCGGVTLKPEVMKRVEEIFAREGSDSWYQRPVADFIVAGLRCDKCGAGDFSKEEDVLDVWFDSGCSQAAVLRQRGLGWPAAAYVEGIDQARGWFQSSLICAVATEERAPYRNVISHGLALDELGRKMSKSLGNFEHAADAVNRMGADVFRLVFASVDYAADMTVGENLFSAVAESYRKLRNTARYMLGNLYDFDPDRDAIAPDAMPDVDRFILSRLAGVKEKVAGEYRGFDFQAAYFALLNFVIGDLSSLYIDVVRDRLYCSGANSRERRSAQSALYKVLYELVRMLAPLIPYTADEVYARIPNHEFDSVHLEQLGGAVPYAPDGYFDTRWSWNLKLRDDVLKLLEEMRQAEVIGAPLEAALSLVWTAEEPETVGLDAPDASWPEALQELFVVSSLEFLSGDAAADLRHIANGRESFTADGWFGRLSQTAPQLYVLGRKAPGRKCLRCWKYYDDDGDPELCPRCRAVVAGLNR